ncbi:hypothetical protein L2D01_00295 [Hyphomonadaceae bacterium ML37]|nr:hypothetical protein L2D01_00295 [Hyphomonadaceae bacterium ML37]
MRLVAWFFVAGLTLTATACVSPQYNYVAPAEQFSRPPLNEIVTVSVGEEMLSQGNLVFQEGITVGERTSIGGYTLHGGFYPQVGQDESSTFHSFLTGNASTSELGALSKNILVDPPQTIQAAIESEELCVVTVFNVRACRDREFERTERVVANVNSFQQTLLYSGRVGDKINISYREFSGSVARPAFSNDVEYDLAASSEIAYRGARIEIIEATNSSITYRILSNFNAASR